VPPTYTHWRLGSLPFCHHHAFSFDMLLGLDRSGTLDTGIARRSAHAIWRFCYCLPFAAAFFAVDLAASAVLEAAAVALGLSLSP
jgi:hypothetical protein